MPEEAPKGDSAENGMKGHSRTKSDMRRWMGGRGTERPAYKCTLPDGLDDDLDRGLGWDRGGGYGCDCGHVLRARGRGDPPTRA